jgi:hemoglobin-like flavoprotein
MDAVRIARASFDRCCEDTRFFHLFYESFFAACPPARPMFAETDFQRQHRLLQHGIGLLFSLNQDVESEPNILTRVANRHGRADLNVDPSWYALFMQALMQTVRTTDPLFGPEVERAWLDATARGIAYMRSKS